MSVIFKTEEVNGRTILTRVEGADDITEITIPGVVTEIGVCAFAGCSSLESIEIPPSVTKIGEYAFGGCQSLQSIVIPNNVTKIGTLAFKGCRNVQSIVIGQSVREIANGAFARCQSLQSIVIPPSVTAIGQRAFANCLNLHHIVLPDTVTIINNHAFVGCQSLQSFEVPRCVTEIGNYAFWRCYSLQYLVIPQSVTKIGNSTFLGCAGLIFLVAPDGLDLSNSGIDTDQTFVYRMSQIGPYLDLSRSMDEIYRDIHAHNTTDNQTQSILPEHIQYLRTKIIINDISAYVSRVKHFARSFINLSATCKHAHNAFWESMCRALSGLPNQLLATLRVPNSQTCAAQTNPNCTAQHPQTSALSIFLKEECNSLGKPSQSNISEICHLYERDNNHRNERNNNRSKRCCLL